jgi:glucan phosphoethanolaminetransferase (alkaline phosphatase superfamily)
VLLIVLDTVRAMDLSLFGYQRQTTPVLARWARRAALLPGFRHRAGRSCRMPQCLLGD